MIANGYWVGFFLSDENVLELEMMVHDFAKILNPLMCTLHKAELYGIQIISQLKKNTTIEVSWFGSTRERQTTFRP